jgi:hypothetical protein
LAQLYADMAVAFAERTNDKTKALLTVYYGVCVRNMDSGVDVAAWSDITVQLRLINRCPLWHLI